MAIVRTYPDWTTDERTMLRQWLEYHRATLELKCEGLTADELRQRAVPPSSLSLLGIVRHMGEVERGWFRRGLAGEDAPSVYYDDANPDGDFDDVDGADIDEAFAYWRAECERAREIEATFASPDEAAPNAKRGVDISVRWVMLHMIEEYARHNGHADLLRERIDGTTGE
jgi:hypothetical protein